MKKLIIILFFSIVLFASCAKSKTFQISEYEYLKAEPYGWVNMDANKIDGVVYQVNAGNVIWSIIAIETVIIPVWLTGWKLFEPVRYDPNLLK